MGVQNQQIIQDSQITASSSTPNHGPGYGRLSPSDYLGSWIPLYVQKRSSHVVICIVIVIEHGPIHLIHISIVTFL